MIFTPIKLQKKTLRLVFGDAASFQYNLAPMLCADYNGRLPESGRAVQ